MSRAERFRHAVNALARWLDAGRPFGLSPNGFRTNGNQLAYHPPVWTLNRLYVAPEVAALACAPSPDSLLYEATVCLRAWWEGEQDLEYRLMRAMRTDDMAEAWTRWDAKEKAQLPAPRRRDYAGLGSVRRLLAAMTRRNRRERAVPKEGLRALLDALPDPSADAIPMGEFAKEGV